jgi:hypothetical protein
VAAAEVVPARSDHLRAVRTEQPVTFDGRLDEIAWKASPSTSDFTQQSPDGGAAPSERTTLRVLYDDRALYVGFDCAHANTPIVGRLTRRDEDSESEWVSIEIDSRRDGRTAFYFAVNVTGVIMDGTLRDGPTGGTSSTEWDENWEARTARTATGWSAEIRIPLRVLRFTPDLDVQDWGLSALRFIAVRQETDVWPNIPREVASPIAFFGRLDGLQHLDPGEPLELRPFGLGRLQRMGADPTIATSGFESGASAGLDLKLHVTPSVTFDGAVNPDFAQIEADQLTFNLNRYEIFYPEKRPLFLEGAEQFTTPLGLFYSRRIGSSPATPTLVTTMSQTERFVRVPEAATIYGAGKMIGRVGDAWTIGALSVLASRNVYQVLPATVAAAAPTADAPPPVPEPRVAEPLTMYNVLRLHRDIGDSAQIGIIGTLTSRFEQTGRSRACPSGGTVDGADRCFRDAYVGGIDGLLRPRAGNYVVSGQLVGGIVEHGQADVQLDGTTIGPGDGGLAGWLRVAKDGGSPILADVTYTGIGRRLTFNDLGFMLRQNLHEVKAGLELRFLVPGASMLERHARLDVTTQRSLSGLDLGTLVELSTWTRFRNFWYLRLALDGAPTHFDDRDVGDGTALERAGYGGAKLEVTTDALRKLSGALKADGRVRESGFGLAAHVNLTVRPLPQLQLDLKPGFDYDRGEPRFTGQTTPVAPDALGIYGRLRAVSASTTLSVSYTFTPRLSLQTYAQLFLAAWHYTDFAVGARGYGRRARLDEMVPLMGAAPTQVDTEQAALNVNAVLRWEYRLGSTIYVVYSRSQAPALALREGEDAGLRVRDAGRVPAIDMLLVKASFWWAH